VIRLTTMCLSLALLAGVVCAADWPMMCHDSARSGIADTPGPSAGTVAWAAQLGGSVDGSPIVVGGRIYVGSSSGEFFCLNRADGSVVWHARTGGTITGGALLRDGRVFVGSGDGFVYAFEADSGDLLWRHRTGRPILAGLALTQDHLIVGSMDRTLRALNQETGRTAWRIDSEGGISAPPAIAGDVIYYGDEVGSVSAVAASEGSRVWTAKLSGRVIAAPTLADGKLLVPLMSLSALSPPGVQFLTAFDVADGKKLWTVPKPTAESVMGSPVVYNGIAWAFTVEGYVSSGILRGFSLADGALIAEQKRGRLVVDASLAVAGDTLYYAGQDGQICFNDAQSGGVRKTVRLGGKIFSSPAIADAKLYVGCQDGKLYCIE